MLSSLITHQFLPLHAVKRPPIVLNAQTMLYFWLLFMLFMTMRGGHLQAHKIKTDNLFNMQTCLGAENVFNFFEVQMFQQRSLIKFSTVLSEIYLSANIRQENKLVISALSYTQLFYSCNAAIL